MHIYIGTYANTYAYAPARALMEETRTGCAQGFPSMHLCIHIYIRGCACMVAQAGAVLIALFLVG